MAKFKRTDTGEIVNVVSWGANGTYTDYYDSKGEFHHTDLNRYNHFEEIIESPQSGIDWEQRKYDLAKDMFSRMMVAFNTDNDKCGFRAAVKKHRFIQRQDRNNVHCRCRKNRSQCVYRKVQRILLSIAKWKRKRVRYAERLCHCPLFQSPIKGVAKNVWHE